MDLLVGATGTVGKHVLEHYKGRKDVRVFVHSDRSENFVKESGIGEIFRGDNKSENSLAQAFKGVDRLFLLTPAVLEQPEVELRFLNAAKNAEVKRVVYISLQYTGSQPNIKITSLHEPAEEWLKKSGLSYVALQPPSFLDNLLWQIEIIKQGHIVYAGVGEGKIAHIDVRDLAHVAYVAMSDKSFQGPLPLTSGRAVSFGEIASELSNQLGFEVSLIQPPAQDWKQGLLSNGTPEWYADALVEGMAYYAAKPTIVAPEPIRKVRKEGPRTLEAFIQEKIVPLAQKR